MAISEKETGPGYVPIEDDDFSASGRESDELLGDGYPTVRPHKTSGIKKKIFIGLGGLTALVAYSILLTTVVSMWWKKQRVHGANVIDSMVSTNAQRKHSC